MQNFDSLINFIDEVGMYDWNNNTDLSIGDGTTCIIESQIDRKRKVVVRLLDEPGGYSNWDQFREIESWIRAFIPDTLRVQLRLW